ncbi:hypothetical protein, partial [Lysobacter capsici]|uniref:hypothetical protein n=1 Tax=Lysobacter capsici TaxID=435897 RepID=UPI00398CE0B1
MSLLLGSEAAQFIQRCEAWNSREQKHTRRAACRMHAVRYRDMDVPCGACLRRLRTCGHLIHKKAFFFGYF